MKQKPIQIFISAVSDEFKSYREALIDHLRSPYITVLVQEQFIPSGKETLDKLDDHLLACDYVVHLVGDMTGSDAMSHGSITSRYHDFGNKMPVILKALDCDKAKFSYTQWEAYLAIYHEIVLIIAIPEASAPRDKKIDPDPVQKQSQADHLKRLESMERYSQFTFKNAESLSIHIFRVLCNLFPVLQREVQSRKLRDRFGKDQVDQLTNLLYEAPQKLKSNSFFSALFVQITGSIRLSRSTKRDIDSVLIHILAEKEDEHELLTFAYLCKERASVLGLDDLKTRLDNWLESVLETCKLEIDAVKGHCADAIQHANVARPPVPRIELAWDSNEGNPEAYLCWGRCREKITGFQSLDTKEVAAFVVDLVDAMWISKQGVEVERFDVFVEKVNLTYPWEYRVGTPKFLPWPTVVRLHRKNYDRRNLSVPPENFDRNGVACLIAECSTSLEDVRTRGAFFAAWCEIIDLETLWQAASLAGIGIWLRTVKPLASPEEFLNELNGLKLRDLPRQVHKKRRESPKDSMWHHITVLYDLPGLPPFDFEADAYNEEDIIKINTWQQ